MIQTTIYDFLNEVNRNIICLPSIQREFVWSQSQIEKLFDSIYKGYPIGTFLAWEIDAENFNRYRFYQLLTNYHSRDNRFNNELIENQSGEYMALIDGQQRITAINIALQGSYTFQKSRRNENFIVQKLYFNILGYSDENQDFEDDEILIFKMLSETEANVLNEIGGVIWHPAADFLTDQWSNFLNIRGNRTPFKNQVISTISRYLKDYQVNELIESQITDRIADHIQNFIQCIRLEQVIGYYLINGQTQLDDVNEIFVRMNQGGTPLSKSDLLFSTLISTWEEGRPIIENLKEEVQQLGYIIDTDFVMRTSLYLTQCPILFKVDSFNTANIEIIKRSFDSMEEGVIDIKTAIVKTFEILKNEIRISDRLIKSKNALIPLIYHVYMGGNLDASSIKQMKRYLFVSLLNKIFGSHGDSLLRSLRSGVTTNGRYSLQNQDFNYSVVVDGVAEAAKRALYNITVEDIESYLEIEKGDERWLILSLIYPDTDLTNLSLSPLYPVSRLNEISIAANEVRIFFGQNNKKIANMALLSLDDERQLKHMPLNNYIQSLAANSDNFRRRHIIPLDTDLDIGLFLSFYNLRSQRIFRRLCNILMDQQEGDQDDEPLLPEAPFFPNQPEVPIDPYMPDEFVAPDIPDNLSDFLKQVNNYQPISKTESRLMELLNTVEFPPHLCDGQRLFDNWYRNNGDILERVFDEVKSLGLYNHKEFMRCAITKNPYFFQTLLCDDSQLAANYSFDYETIVIGNAVDSGVFITVLYSPRMQTSSSHNVKQLILDIIKLNWTAIYGIPSEIQFYNEYYELAFSKNFRAFDLASEAVRDNLEYAIAALEKDMDMYQFVSARLKEDRDLASMVVSHHAYSINFVSAKYREDKEIVLNAVSQNGLALQWIPSHWREDRDVVMAAIIQNPKSILYLKKKIRIEFGLEN